MAQSYVRYPESRSAQDKTGNFCRNKFQLWMYSEHIFSICSKSIEYFSFTALWTTKSSSVRGFCIKAKLVKGHWHGVWLTTRLYCVAFSNRGLISYKPSSFKLFSYSRWLLAGDHFKAFMLYLYNAPERARRRFEWYQLIRLVEQNIRHSEKSILRKCSYACIVK